MHTPVPVITGHAVPPVHLSQFAAAVTALVVAALIIGAFKLAGRLLRPRKPKGRAASLYPTRGR